LPAEHPPRRIEADVDAALRLISGELDALRGWTGCPSIASERFLRAQPPIAVNSIRSDWGLREQLDYEYPVPE
jgi:hypothetical protein